jgi:hypothetical protein
MAEHPIIEITVTDNAQLASQLLDAAQRAHEDQRMTFITSAGKRIGAVVPIGIAVALEPGDGVQLGIPSSKAAE